MNKLHPNEPDREYTHGEQSQSFIGRRAKAFADRSREPGDGGTWAVVLGALMLTLLMLCYSVAGQPLIAVGVFLLFAVWIIVMARFARVNVFSILWGSATSDADVPPNDIVIFQSTVALALISLIAAIMDAVRGWAFGWYGLALLMVVATFLVVYLRAGMFTKR